MDSDRQSDTRRDPKQASGRIELEQAKNEADLLNMDLLHASMSQDPNANDIAQLNAQITLENGGGQGGSFRDKH